MHAHIFPLGLPDWSDLPGGTSIPRLVSNGSHAVIELAGAPYRDVDDSYWALEPRLKWMEELGIDRQVISPLPVLLTYSAPPRRASDFVRRLNASIADFVAHTPDKFVGFGTVPLQDPKLAIAELERIRGLGLRGVEIGTRAGEVELGAPEVLPFFQAAADLGIPLLVHTQEGAGLGRMEDPLVRFGVGVPADASIAVAHLFLARTLAEVPGLRICVCHGGGAFFWALHRMRHIVRHSLGEDAESGLVDAIRGVYVDTASLGLDNLDYLLKVLPVEQLLLGSDYPATQAISPLEALESGRFDPIRRRLVVENVNTFLADG